MRHVDNDATRTDGANEPPAFGASDDRAARTGRIGARLRAARRAGGQTLAELARRTGDIYSRSRISNYEQGLRRLSVEAAIALADALGTVSAAHLLELEANGPAMISADEQRLLAAFRRTDNDGRRRVLDCAGAVVATTPIQRLR